MSNQAATAKQPNVVNGVNVDQINSVIDFRHTYQFQIANEASGTYNHHMLNGFSFEITSVLDIDITLVWDRIQDPRADSDGNVPLSDDFRLILGLGLDL